MGIFSIVGELGPVESIELIKSGNLFAGGDVILQEREKPRNNVADKMRQLMESWEQSISPTNRRFGERFVAGEIHILIVFRVVETGEIWFVCLERNSTNDNVLADRQDETMLISVVESAEKPKSLISTLVWFERINGLNRLPPRTLYASFAFRLRNYQGNEI